MAYKHFHRAGYIRKRKALKMLEFFGYFIFVAGAIFVHEQLSWTVILVTLLLFGGGCVMVLRDLLQPESALGHQMLAQNAHDKQNDLGNFSFDDQGFTGLGTVGKFYCRWQDIDVLFAYKEYFIEERFASEEIILNLITTEQKFFRLNNYLPGWPQFRIRLQEHFPELPLNWEENMAFPVFETNPTLLYDRQHRSQAEILQRYYSNGFNR